MASRWQTVIATLAHAHVQALYAPGGLVGRIPAGTELPHPRAGPFPDTSRQTIMQKAKTQSLPETYKHAGPQSL